MIVDPRLKRRLIEFHCYRQHDVARFCRLLDESGAKLMFVMKIHEPLTGGFIIAYAHTEPLDMEVCS